MEEVALLPNELMATPIKMPIKMSIKDAGSIILENPLGILEKLGKYEFIYDYKTPSAWDKILASSVNIPLGQSLLPSNLVKEGGSNANMIAPNMIWSGQSFPQPVNVNSEPQVGTFSKGNIVNVLRFDGNNAIIQNPNYIQPEPNAPKVGFFSGLDLKNQKEFTIPKSYLRKVDDNLSVTVSTGILYGANIEQPVYNIPPVKSTIGSGTQLGQVLETNVTYTISKPFTFTKSYTNVRPLYELGGAGMLQYEQKANYDTLPIGFEVTGNLMSQMVMEKKSFSNMGVPPPPKYVQDVLVVNGMGQNGQLIIPVEYLTKKVQTNTPTNSGTVVPVANDNKNMLMIIGAFLVGYVLFSKNNSTN